MAQNENGDEKFTPKIYLASVRKVFGGTIDLDPASSAKANIRVRATRFFTKEQDGLKQEWNGNVWLNPPYSRGNLFPFTQKLIEEYTFKRTNQAILLVPNWSERTWFQNLLNLNFPCCLTDHRIKFINGTTLCIEKNPENGSAFFYLGKKRLDFYLEFKRFGFIINPFESHVCRNYIEED